MGWRLIGCALLAWAAFAQTLTIEYPLDGSIFPPDFTPPTFIWRDDAATSWKVRVGDLIVDARADKPKLGEIDPRCIAPTNELPKVDERQRVWKPDATIWREMQHRSPAVIEIAGYRDARQVSRGEVRIEISRDPVGAPIFYRDVPLMPSETQKGVIKPIPPKLLPYIAWRLRYVNESSSRVVMEGLHTCANCHSFSRDGKTLGLDLDGPHNDKGLYALVPVRQQTTIRNEDVVSWKSFRGETSNEKRIGFMSQVSPNGRYVITATQVEYFVANYKNYKFLQAFYPTRGILAWYDRETGRMQSLPGADDPRYVQANAVWSPDGQYLVFVRATARDSYPEPQIQYDLYRIPFNGGKGGKAEPIAGASQNGMSNSFPKFSPDGKWIVYVQARNGQLMRPDSQLYIVPAAGGTARRMRCNTPLMNSWHSFSPNGRWMVFSSKSRSPYTQMFLTHIDENGNDSPAILIENSTAANRAVNIPEFVNIQPGQQFAKIDAPASEFYRLYDEAWDFTERGQVDAAIEGWRRALRLDPNDDKANTNIGALLLAKGELEDAAAHFRTALKTNPDFASARVNLGLILLERGKVDEAAAELKRAVELDPRSVEAHANLGNALLTQRRYAEALAEWKAALTLDPYKVPVLTNVAWLLATCPDPKLRNGREAVEAAELALKAAGARDPAVLEALKAARAEAAR